MDFDPQRHKIVAVHAADGPERGQHMHLSLPELVGAVNALPDHSVEWSALQDDLQANTRAALAAFDALSARYEDLLRQNQDLAARLDKLERLMDRILDIPVPVDLEVA
jgi:hypothetical protein